MWTKVASGMKYTAPSPFPTRKYSIFPVAFAYILFWGIMMNSISRQTQTQVQIKIQCSRRRVMWTKGGLKLAGCIEIRYQCSYKYNLYCANTTTETNWVYVVRGVIWTNVGGNAVGCNEIKWRRYPVMRAHLCGHTHPQVFSWNFLKKKIVHFWWIECAVYWVSIRHLLL